MRRLAPALVVLALVVSACSNDGDGAGTVSPTPTVTTTPSPAATTNVKSGSATAEVSGAETFTVEVALSAGDSQFNPPPAGFAFVFKDDDDNLITLGGEAFSGSRKTAGTLALGMVFNREGKVIAHTDTSGGCDLTMKQDGKTVTGTFDCAQVEDGRYAVKGRFTVELA